jgi:protease I
MGSSSPVATWVPTTSARTRRLDEGKAVGVICHGPWVLVEADVLEGRMLTSYPSVKTDIRNAGGEWVDEERVVDDGLVTSRSPDDLDAFCEGVVDAVAKRT